jgi:ribonuclease P protein component
VIQLGNSFPKSYRVLLKKDFSYLRDQSRKDFESPLIIYSKASRLNLSHARLGMSISSKQGNSVRRNRIKRLLREEFRNNPLRQEIPLDLLLVGAHKITDEAQLVQSFKKALSKLHQRK